jgi:hypothetical protein
MSSLLGSPKPAAPAAPLTLKKAERKTVKLKIAISGPSGSGKTYSSLLMASGMTSWDKIVVIDTEAGSGSLYTHLGPYNVIELAAPFTPERFVEAIKTAVDAGMDVVVIDSMSMEWNGRGGVMDIYEQLGGTFSSWSKVTPRHNKFIDAILQAPIHVIGTMRSKVDYSIEKTEGGRTVVNKVGMKREQRDDTEYAFTAHLELSNQANLAKAGKDRTGLFQGHPDFVIDASVGKALIKWSQS